MGCQKPRKELHRDLHRVAENRSGGFLAHPVQNGKATAESSSQGRKKKKKAARMAAFEFSATD
jgi:hypothetical protein